jgi:hypothetical protein
MVMIRAARTGSGAQGLSSRLPPCLLGCLCLEYVYCVCAYVYVCAFDACMHTLFLSVYMCELVFSIASFVCVCVCVYV